MRRLKADRIAMISLFVVLCYFVVLVLSMTGLVASNWNKEVAGELRTTNIYGSNQEAAKKVESNSSSRHYLKTL